jgi:hypothetical protein
MSLRVLAERLEQLIEVDSVPIGTVHHWDSGDHKKTAPGKWVPVSGQAVKSVQPTSTAPAKHSSSCRSDSNGSSFPALNPLKAWRTSRPSRSSDTANAWRWISPASSRKWFFIANPFVFRRRYGPLPPPRPA